MVSESVNEKKIKERYVFGLAFCTKISLKVKVCTPGKAKLKPRNCSYSSTVQNSFYSHMSCLQLEWSRCKTMCISITRTEYADIKKEDTKHKLSQKYFWLGWGWEIRQHKRWRYGTGNFSCCATRNSGLLILQSSRSRNQEERKAQLLIPLGEAGW